MQTKHLQLVANAGIKLHKNKPTQTESTATSEAMGEANKRELSFKDIFSMAKDARSISGDGIGLVAAENKSKPTEKDDLLPVDVIQGQPQILSPEPQILFVQPFSAMSSAPTVMADVRGAAEPRPEAHISAGVEPGAGVTQTASTTAPSTNASITRPLGSTSSLLELTSKSQIGPQAPATSTQEKGALLHKLLTDEAKAANPLAPTDGLTAPLTAPFFASLNPNGAPHSFGIKASDRPTAQVEAANQPSLAAEQGAFVQRSIQVTAGVIHPTKESSGSRVIGFEDRLAGATRNAKFLPEKQENTKQDDANAESLMVQSPSKASLSPVATQEVQRQAQRNESLLDWAAAGQKDASATATKDANRGTSLLLQATFLSDVKKAAQATKVEGSPIEMGALAQDIGTKTPLISSFEARAEASLAIPQRVDSEFWPQELSGRVMMMVGAKLTEAKVNVNPVNLGPIEINISVDAGSVNASFSVSNNQVAEAIRASLGELRQAVETGGMLMGNVSVSVSSAGLDLSSGQQQQQNSGNSHGFDGSSSTFGEQGRQPRRNNEATSRRDQNQPKSRDGQGPMGRLAPSDQSSGVSVFA